MLEQIEAIKQIFCFQVLAPVMRGFCKSTLGAGTPTHRSGSCALPEARAPWWREAHARQLLLVSPGIKPSLPLTYSHSQPSTAELHLLHLPSCVLPWGNGMYRLS